MSLNTISLLCTGKSNTFFPQLPSRNKKIVAGQTVIKSLVKSRNLNFDSGFYKNYLNILKYSVIECGNKFDIQTAEMVLFANAEDLSKKWC